MRKSGQQKPGRKSNNRTAAKIKGGKEFPDDEDGRGNGWVKRSCHSSRSAWALLTPARSAKSETK